MSSTDRQNRLLVAEDWKRIYQTFRNADFQSYDFENLRRVMISYIRENYPEDFNDYVESSEYLALIDLIAFLGQSIAFRVDLNARDNFLELAERRESVLRLARLLSYNAKRNLAANGFLKFTSVKTTEAVIDSNNRNLSGVTVAWNDPTNANWLEQFTKVINSALEPNRQFGKPDAKATIAGIPTEQYRFKGISTDVPVFGFTKTVDGRNMQFEITSTVIDTLNAAVKEEPPALGVTPAFIYKDDGKGAGSSNTGFFFHFRQGQLNTGTFTLDQPGSNEIVDIDAANINDTDVWLYKLDNNGRESQYWAPVSDFKGNNTIYNSLEKNIRNIYSVITRVGDRISLNFSDGVFGTLPLGTFRIYYRTSNGFSYTINPKDIRSVSVDISYVSNTGQIEVLTINMSLLSTVVNSAATETNDSIKTNAPASYYTQNRMITGEDYNISPLTVSQQILKIKSVNRSSSGISRYFDLVDPTGKYSKTNLFSDDGVVYKELYSDSFRFSYVTKTDIEFIVYNQLFNVIKDDNLKNYFYANYEIDTSVTIISRWYSKTVDTNQSTGYFGNITDTIPYATGQFTSTDLTYIESGALVKFTAPTGQYFNKSSNNKLETIPSGGIPSNGSTVLWTKIVSVTGDGTANNTGTLSTGFGPIILNDIVPNDARLSRIIPKYKNTIESSTITTIIDLVFDNRPFGLRYDRTTRTWKIVFEQNLNVSDLFSLGKAGDRSNQKLDSSWLILFTPDEEFYTVNSRKLRYIFESDQQIRFYYDSSDKIYDTRTNTVAKDKIKVLSINTAPAPSNSAYTFDRDWSILKEYSGLDGYVDTKKIEITFTDTDEDSVVDNPDIFNDIVDPPSSTETNLTVLQRKYIVQEKYTIGDRQEDYRYIYNDLTNPTVIILPSETSISSFSQYAEAQHFYFIDTDVIKKLDKVASTLIPSLQYKVLVGRDRLKFQYIHNADYETRIDPGITNIIDIFILTKEYDTAYRQYVNGSIEEEPLPPSSDSLYNDLHPTLRKIKSISDEIIYHPVKFKVLFGSLAKIDLQATFKVVKNIEQVISDNDVKTRILNSITKFFSIENWDFGNTFYFGELSTFVLAELSPFIVSFVVVPKADNLYFGSLFEITCEKDEIFVNAATVDDIEIVSSITASKIKAIGAITTTEKIANKNQISSS
jgi:hypothetical protein